MKKLSTLLRSWRATRALNKSSKLHKLSWHLPRKISGDSARLKVCNAFIWHVASHPATDLCGKMKYDCLVGLVFHCLQMVS